MRVNVRTTVKREREKLPDACEPGICLEKENENIRLRKQQRFANVSCNIPEVYKPYIIEMSKDHISNLNFSICKGTEGLLVAGFFCNSIL